jgi:hypothetical protein
MLADFSGRDAQANPSNSAQVRFRIDCIRVEGYEWLVPVSIGRESQGDEAMSRRFIAYSLVASSIFKKISGGQIIETIFACGWMHIATTQCSTRNQ